MIKNNITLLIPQVSTITSILLSLIPFILLINLNLLIYRMITQNSFHLPKSSTRERRNIQVVTILILITMVYVACHAIITSINVLELAVIIKGKNSKLNMFIKLNTSGDDHRLLWGPKMDILVAISHVLITVGCSSNFVIYCFKVNGNEIL